MQTEQHNDLLKDTEVFGVSLSLLISRANEKSATMPSGLTREQRRAWAAKHNAELMDDGKQLLEGNFNGKA